jgi:hypothetical protein
MQENIEEALRKFNIVLDCLLASEQLVLGATVGNG